MTEPTTDYLYTMVMEFRGGTYISQVRAATPMEAMRRWGETLDPRGIQGMGEAVRQALPADMEDEHAVALRGVANVWCFTIRPLGRFAIIHMIRTDEPDPASDVVEEDPNAEFWESSARVNALFDRREYAAARPLIEDELLKTPDHHFWLTRLSTVLHHEGSCQESLEASERALGADPGCPLVRWDYAVALDGAGRKSEAIAVWKSMIHGGMRKLAYGDCGEGVRGAESMINDCRYRIAHAYHDLGHRALARRYLLAHLEHRRQGLPSLHDRREVERFRRRVAVSMQGFPAVLFD